MNNILCIFHGNCADGFGAAYAVWKAAQLAKTQVEFHAGVYQKEPPDVTGKHVIMVDFSYKRPVLIEMAHKAKSITILDHHKSAADDLSIFKSPDAEMDMTPDEFAAVSHYANVLPVRARFDMEKSGAMLAWEYFHPNTPAPRLLRHIQDRDLWRFELFGTRAVQANLFSYPYDFEVWDELMQQDPLQLMSDGTAIERKHFKDIREFIKVAAHRAVIGGHDVPVLNCPYHWSSDAGHILAIGEKFAACYWDIANGERTYSLRSTENGIDVQQIAKMYGGGGHRNAAGFTLKAGQAL